MDNTQALKETTDKLKEIREKETTYEMAFAGTNVYEEIKVARIQQASYDLGITTERKTIHDKIYNYFNGENKTRLTTNSAIVINDILTSLKEKNSGTTKIEENGTK